MSIETRPCPTCGKDLMVGFEHPECIGINPNSMVERRQTPFGEVIVFGAGANLNDVLNVILGKGPLAVKAEQFDFTMNDGSLSLTINITALSRGIIDGKVDCERVLSEMDPGLVDTLLANGSVDMDHVMRVTADRLTIPVIFIEPQPDMGQYVLADGQHRYVAAFLNDHREVRAFLIPFAAWQPYGKITINQAQIQGQLQGSKS